MYSSCPTFVCGFAAQLGHLDGLLRRKNINPHGSPADCHGSLHGSLHGGRRGFYRHPEPPEPPSVRRVSPNIATPPTAEKRSQPQLAEAILGYIHHDPRQQRASKTHKGLFSTCNERRPPQPVPRRTLQQINMLRVRADNPTPMHSDVDILRGPTKRKAQRPCARNGSRSCSIG